MGDSMYDNTPTSRFEEGMRAMIDGTPWPDRPPKSKMESLLKELNDTIKSGGGGGGAVNSVNGKTGDVTLDAEDVGALPDDTDIPTKTSDLTNDSGFIANTVNNLLNYYLKSETYTKTEIDTKIAAIPKMHFEPVLTLPTEDIDMMAIYLVPKSISQTNNVKDEYINLDGTTAGWELIGDTEVDLSGYVTTTALNTALADYVTSTGLATILADYATTSAMNTALAGKADNATTLAGYGITDAYTKSAVDTALAGKVDAVSGKGLSSNDYSNADKAIVDGVTSALAGKADSTDVSTKENLKLASSGTTASGEIRFGVDGQGNYGYIKAGADSVTPFKNPTGNKAIPQITQNGTVTGIDVEDYATASLDIAVPAPTGTKNISITQNGTTTEDVANYGSAQISVNVPDAYLNKIRKKFSGVTFSSGRDVWTDGSNIYYSSGSQQYVLNKLTSTWVAKTWNGLTSFNGRNVWTDGSNIYYSTSSVHKVLDRSTSTWTDITWDYSSGYNYFYKGNGCYFSNNYYYFKDSEASGWSYKSISGMSSFSSGAVWIDERTQTVYYSNGSIAQKVLDETNMAWVDKVWNGLTPDNASYIWTDGDNIYYSYNSVQKVLNRTTSTWEDKTWKGLSSFSASNIWTDGELIYYGTSYVLDKIVTGDTWYPKNLT